MRLMLLPGMDGTGRLFGPLLRILPQGLEVTVFAYPPDRPCGYAELLPLVEAAVPEGGEFVVLGESFSGPLALLLAARRPRGLRGVILCASFARGPWRFPARWLGLLIRPFWFRAVPGSLIRRAARAFRYAPARRDGRGRSRRGPPGGAGGAGARRAGCGRRGAIAGVPRPDPLSVSHGGSPGIGEEPGPHQRLAAPGRGGGLGGPPSPPPGCPGAGCPGDPAVRSVLWNTELAA